jgi:hypothetical protein
MTTINLEAALAALQTRVETNDRGAWPRTFNAGLLAAMETIRSLPSATVLIDEAALAEAISAAWAEQGHDAATVDGHRLSTALAHLAARTAAAWGRGK